MNFLYDSGLFLMKMGETKFFNLDSNSTFEVLMTLENIDSGKATLAFNIVEELAGNLTDVEEQKNEIERPLPQISGFNLTNNTLRTIYGLIITFIVIIIITIAIMLRKYKKIKKFYSLSNNIVLKFNRESN